LSPNRFRSWYDSGPDRLLILAHRGDSFRAPENTLEAARLGHESGADGWELDVRMTRDGVPVVIHDESLARTTDVARRFEGDPRATSGFLVGDFTLGEVRSLDAGSWFLGPGGGARSAAGFGSGDRLGRADRLHLGSGRVRVPTLAEALELSARLDWMVNIEIKPTPGRGQALVEAVLGSIRASGTRHLVAVSSFDHAIVAHAASAGAGIATGALVDGPPDRPAADLLRRLGADALHAPFGWMVGPGPVPDLGGVPVLVYTVNDAGSSGPAVRLADAGVSGLFTDDPARFTRRSPINPS